MTTDPTFFFTPREITILGTYLGAMDRVLACYHQPDALQIVDPRSWNTYEGGIALHKNLFETEFLALENAVARICLGTDTPRVLVSRFLFEINWADGWPGSNGWPETYRMVKIPWFHFWIVVAIADCPDAMGFTAFAVGHFSGAESEIKGIQKAITGYWAWYREKAAANRWENIIQPGSVSVETALQWRDEAWPTVPQLDQQRSQIKKMEAESIWEK